MFGQFIGGWSLEARWFMPDGRTRSGKGEVHFGWILEGRAIQDVFSTRKGRRLVPTGTTLRFFDPKVNAWHCVWISPRQGAVRTFVARRAGEEIVLEGHTSGGEAEQWIFSDITRVSFRWRAVEWDKARNGWRLTEKMEAKRLARRLSRG